MVREQREKKQNGQKGDKRFESEGRAECYISRGEAKLDSGDIQARGVRGGSHSATGRCNGGSYSGGGHSVTERDAAGEQLQE